MERKLRYSWILPDSLAVGEKPGQYDELAGLGFSAVLSLQEEDEPGPEGEPPQGLSFARVPIRDGLYGGMPEMEQIREAVDSVARFLEEGRRTYIHCYAGIGRAPLVCMAYLARSRKLSLGDVYRMVVEAHPRTDPTAEQLLVLSMFIEDGKAVAGKDPAAAG